MRSRAILSPERDGFNFAASSRQRQKYDNASSVALATGYFAPNFYGKKKHRPVNYENAASVPGITEMMFRQEPFDK